VLLVPDDPLHASNRRITILVRRQHSDAGVARGVPVSSTDAAKP
jgi:hypothetical protein